MSVLDNQRIPINSTERAKRIESVEKAKLTPYYGATGQVGWIDEHIFDEELVLLGEDGAPFLQADKDKAYMIHGKSWVNNHAHVLRGSSNLVDNRYLCHYLNQVNYRDYVTGTTRLKLNQSRLKQIPFKLAPLAEQKRIVEAIETQFTRLDQATAVLHRLKQNIQRYRASVLKHACEGRLLPQDPRDEPADQLLQRILAERRRQWEAEAWQKEVERAQKKATTAVRKAAGKSTKMRDIPDAEWQALPAEAYTPYLPQNDKWKQKYQEPPAPDTADLPDLSAGWVWATIDQVAEQRLGKMLDKRKNEGEETPYLRNANVRWFAFDLDDISLIRVKKEELAEISVSYGDLVMCEGGEPGRCAVWDKDEPFVIQKALHRIRLYLDSSPWYLSFVFASDANVGKLEKHFTGSTIKHFTGQSLRTYPIPLPPVSEQKRIVAEVERRLSLLDALEETITTSLGRAQRLRQAILKRAFSGQLVPPTGSAS